MNQACIISIVFSVGLLSSCAPPNLIPKESLHPVSDGLTIEIKQDFLYRSLSASKSTWGIATIFAGKYKATLENDGGIFYKGPHSCIGFEATNAFGKKEIFYQDGGFWLPKYPSREPIRCFVFACTLTFNRSINALPADHVRDTDQSVNNLTFNAMPQSSPVASGIGGGIAKAIILSASNVDPSRITFMFDSLPNDFQTQLNQ